MAGISDKQIDAAFAAAIESADRQALRSRADIESAVLYFVIGYLGATKASAEIDRLVEERDAVKHSDALAAIEAAEGSDA